MPSRIQDRGRSTMDNIYILQHVVEKEGKQKNRKGMCVLHRFKSSVSISKQGKIMGGYDRKGNKKSLIERVREIYKETKDRVRVGNGVSEEFSTELGLRQGCPLSPLLFAVFIADMEEVLKRGLEGGIAVGGSRFWILAYAEDIIVIIREEEVLRSMMKRLEKYLEERKLTLNAEKSKVMVFDKQRRKREEREWVWKGEKIEELKEFIYLGFLLRKNGNIKGHMREIVKRVTIIMKKV